MTQKDLANTICAFLNTELLPGATVAPDDDILLSGMVDSIGVIELVTFVEETTGLPIPPEDILLENFMSPIAIAEYVTGRQAA